MKVIADALGLEFNNVDSMAVAVDDEILTVIARIEMLDHQSLKWLHARMREHASETIKSGDMAKTHVLNALSALIVEGLSG